MNFHVIRVYFRYLSIARLDFLSVFLVLGGVTLVVIGVCAPLLYWAESAQPDANITNLGDAIWLCFMIVTTIGFGDHYPITLIGRIAAVPLAATGIGVFGTLAGYFGSIILDRVVRQASTDMLHQQNSRIEQLAKQNQELNEIIRSVAYENKELNRMIVELTKSNKEIIRKVDQDTDDILDYLRKWKHED